VLQFDIDVTAADADTRTIEGIAVPYGETANLGGTTYTFDRGSLQPARTRTPLLLGHDRNRPVGVMLELADTPEGAIARFRVDQGAEGDLALEQATTGSRGGLSIGAEIITAEDAGNGIVNVKAAALLEVSLVAIAAFSGAAVTNVAADADPFSSNTDAGDEQPDPDPTDSNPAPVQENTDMETMPEPIAAETAPIPTITQKQPELSADAFVSHMLKAQMGNNDSARVVEAALSVIDTADVVGLVPDFYTMQIIGGLSENRPLANNVRRAALPASGMSLVKPQWTTTPVGGWIDQNDPTPSNAMAIGNHEIDVAQWAYGVAMTVASLERGVGVAESAFTQIVRSYYSDVETRVATAIATAAGAVASGASTLATIGLLSAAVYQDSGRRPDKVYMATDVWAGLLATEGSLPFTGGQTSASGIAGQIAGLDIVVTPSFSAGGLIVADSSVIELRESAPLQLRANVIGSMQIELGVTSFVTTDVELADAVKIAD
jgi:HK97 family phage prohead protease